ncbi:hypothetical protein HK096_004270, partial [Nowakowskiella sp. JEL0078]
MEDLIALHEIGDIVPLGRSVDLMFGGGRCHFLKNSTVGSCRNDDIDVKSIAIDKGWNWFETRNDFDGLNIENPQLPVAGIFTPDHMSYNIDRDPKVEPSLLEMASTAIKMLHQATFSSDKGFFIMIEGSRIDMAAHSNDPATHLREILAYNEVIEWVKNYVDEHPDTVMISVSDHETGGFSVAKQVDKEYPSYLWYPEALSPITNSTEIIAPAILEKNPDEKRDFVVDVVLKEWMSITNASESEIDELCTATRIYDIEEILGGMASTLAQVNSWCKHHSAVDVNLYAYGHPDHYKLFGNHENTDIGEFITEFLSLDLQSVTTRLR